MKTTRRSFRVCLAAAVLAPVFFAGCESSDSESDDWSGSSSSQPAAESQQAQSAAATAETKTDAAAAPAAKTAAAAPAAAASTASTQSNASAAQPSSAATGGAAGQTAASALAADAVPFSSLKWHFGGKPKASGARQSSVEIAGLSIGSSKLSFRYKKDLSAWGLAYGEAGAIACLFVQKENGQWVGGKFDWISSSRTSRGFENVFAGYEGWTLAGVPNPCQAAFVIVSADGTKRSNVLAGRWAR